MEKENNSKIFLIAIIAILVIVLISNNFNLSGEAVKTKSTVINAQCGSMTKSGIQLTALSPKSPGLCNIGNPTSFTTTSTGWEWFCFGQNGGKNVACKATKLIIHPNIYCGDSDYGKNDPYTVGICTDWQYPSGLKDYCYGGKVIESYCSYDESLSYYTPFCLNQPIDCSNGCKDGACIPKDITTTEEVFPVEEIKYFEVGNKVKLYNGRMVTLVSVGSTGAVIVDVDGVQGTIFSSKTKTINGLIITNKKSSYNFRKPSASAATLVFT